MKKNKLRFAVQKSGRLREESLLYVEKMQAAKIFDRVEFLFLRDDDIPRCVAGGAIDLGIVGKNLLYEEKLEKLIVEELPFAFCKLMIAAKEDDNIGSIQDLEGLRIATSYPRLLSAYLKANNVRASLVELSGEVEVAPSLNLAEAVCDLVQTGSTLSKNGLKPLWTIFESCAVLIARPGLQVSI